MVQIKRGRFNQAPITAGAIPTGYAPGIKSRPQKEERHEYMAGVMGEHSDK